MNNDQGDQVLHSKAEAFTPEKETEADGDRDALEVSLLFYSPGLPPFASPSFLLSLSHLSPLCWRKQETKGLWGGK